MNDSATRCDRCGQQFLPDIMFGDLRFWVCRPCGAWAVPFPPSPTRLEDGREAPLDLADVA